MNVLASSLGLCALASSVAVILGFAAAVTWLRSGSLGRLALALSAGGSLVLPGFLTANAWLGLTAGWRSGPSGSGDVQLCLLVAGILGLQYWPVAAAFTAGRSSFVDPAVVESDSRLRGRHLLRHVILPVLAPGLVGGGVVVLSLALSSFTVPVLFQVPVFSEVMWVRFNTRLDAVGAFRSAIPSVLAGAAVVGFLRVRGVAWPRLSGPVRPEAWRRALGPAGRVAVVVTLLAVGLSLVLPIADLAFRSRTWRELPAAFAAGRVAAGNSLLTAGAAALACLAAAAVLSGAGRRAVRGPVAAWLLFLMPGLLLGIAAIAVLNRPGMRWIYPGLAVPVGLLALRHLAPLWACIAAAARSVDPASGDLVRSSGGRARDVWRLALLPPAGPGVLLGTYAVFLLGLSDVETLVLVIPPGGETLALRIFNLLHYGHATQVHALCVVLIGIAMLPAAAVAVVLGGVALLRRARGLVPGAVALCLLCGCRPEAPPGTAVLEGPTFERVEVIGGRGVAPGQFNKPRSVVCGRDDHLYVADLTGRIQRFTPEGRFVLQWQMPETDLGKPKGLGVDPDGNIIVVEPHYMRINHFTPSGELVAQWGRRGTNAGEFTLPRAVAVSAAGEYFLSEYTVVDRVQRFVAEAPRQGRSPGLVAAWGAPGLEPGRFNRAEGLDVGPDGRVYVADSCNHRIQVFDAGGKFLRAHGRAGSNAGEFSYPYDVRVDRQGNQYICEFGNSRITVLDAADRVVEVIGGPGAAPGEFANPWSVALDSRGNLYVADSRNHRVQKLVRRAPRRGGPAG